MIACGCAQSLLGRTHPLECWQTFLRFAVRQRHLRWSRIDDEPALPTASSRCSVEARGECETRIGRRGSETAVARTPLLGQHARLCKVPPPSSARASPGTVAPSRAALSRFPCSISLRAKRLDPASPKREIGRTSRACSRPRSTPRRPTRRRRDRTSTRSIWRSRTPTRRERSRSRSPLSMHSSIAWRLGFDELPDHATAFRSRELTPEVVGRLSKAWDAAAKAPGEARAIARGMIAEGLHEIALYMGDNHAASMWGARRGCATSACARGAARRRIAPGNRRRSSG